jgi:hypothetical protein
MASFWNDMARFLHESKMIRNNLLHGT